MFSIDALRLIADEREREIQQRMRIRRLLHGNDPEPPHPASAYGLEGSAPAAWRSKTSRASATTR